MAHVVRDFDVEKITDFKEDIDTLLVFVRKLFSSTVTRTNCVSCVGWSFFCGSFGVFSCAVPTTAARPDRPNGGSA